MRRRAGDMGDAARAAAAPRDRAMRLAGLRQHHRAAADDGAQEYLQAAVAANVVECRPDRRGCRAQALRRRSRRSVLRAYGRRSSARPMCPRSASAIRWRVRSCACPRPHVRAGRRRRPSACHHRPSLRPIGDDRHRSRHPQSAPEMRSGSRSGGHRSMRRATPSSSIMASAGLQLPRRRKQHRSAGQLARICRSDSCARECRSAIRCAGHRKSCGPSAPGRDIRAARRSHAGTFS